MKNTIVIIVLTQKSKIDIKREVYIIYVIVLCAYLWCQNVHYM